MGIKLCGEECQHFRLGDCITMSRPENGVWICDKPEKYSRN